MARKQMNFASVRDIALTLPDVEDTTTARGVAFKARGKLLTCAAIHSSAEEGSLAVRIDPQLRSELLASEPDVYYVTPHYAPHPMVLVRLARTRPAALRKLLETAWIFVTSKTARNRPRAAPKRPGKRRSRRAARPGE